MAEATVTGGPSGAEPATPGGDRSPSHRTGRGYRTGPGDRTGQGPGRVLVAVYAFFALSAGVRAGWQLATRFAEAPVAYLLSALAAVIYLVAAVGLARGGPGGRRLALVCCTIELAGVLLVGTASLALPESFPQATVWSSYGVGYGFVPLVLPVLGLLWLRRTRRPPP